MPSRPRSSSRKRLFAWTLVLALLLGIAALVAWRSESWVQKRIIQSYIDRIQPSLPFKIEKFEIETHWKDLRSGRISRVAMTLSRTPFRLQVEGPVDLGWDSRDSEWTGVYSAIARWEGPIQIEPTRIRLEVSAPKSLKSIREFKLSASTPKIAGAVEIEDLVLEAHWADLQWSAKLLARKFAWTDAAISDRAVHIDHPELSLQGPMTLAPFSLDGTQALHASGRGIEALWDKSYFDLPTARAPIEGALHWKSGPESLVLRSLGHEIRLHPGFRGSTLDSLSVGWNIRELPIPATLRLLAGVPQLGWSQPIQWKSGRLTSWGNLRLDWEGNSPSARIEHLSGKVRVRDLGIRWKEKRLALRGLTLDLPLNSTPSAASKIVLSIEKLFFQKFRMTLPPTEILTRSGPEGAFSLDTGTPLALAIEGVPLRIGRISARIDGPRTRFASSLRLESTPLENFRKGLCWEKKTIPPAALALDFPNVEADPEMIDPQGKLTLKLFEGAVTIEDIAFFDTLTEVPESDFTANWDGIRLDRMAEWLGFGEMDGILTGYARNVTFESWFPTHYDLLVRAKPHFHRDIVFSPDAMKNFVRLFAGEDVEQLMPGLARWLAFGWPSRVFGGYDVNYLGIRAFSEGGSILVETLDSGREHFVLKGDRFKMPLHSQHYPLIMDATALGNFVRQVAKQLDTIARQKKESAHAKNPTAPLPTAPTSDEIEPPCLPPEIF